MVKEAVLERTKCSEIREVRRRARTKRKMKIKNHGDNSRTTSAVNVRQDNIKRE